jgi:hypothetical protein
MDKKLIQSASEKLDLSDIVLHECSLRQQDSLGGISVVQPFPNFHQQNKVSCRADEITIELDGEDDLQMLRVFVELGARAMGGSPEAPIKDDQDSFLYGVEAVYRAEYLIKEPLTDEEVREFSEHNAVHNVWPFWRMHVFNALKLANLPILNVPLKRLTPRS